MARLSVHAVADLLSDYVEDPYTEKSLRNATADVSELLVALVGNVPGKMRGMKNTYFPSENGDLDGRTTHVIIFYSDATLREQMAVLATHPSLDVFTQINNMCHRAKARARNSNVKVALVMPSMRVYDERSVRLVRILQKFVTICKVLRHNSDIIKWAERHPVRLGV